MSGWWAIALSIVAGLALLMVPLPEAVEPLRPDWVALVVLYWALALPQRFGLLAAWITGLLVDATQGTLLGQHALGMVLITAVILHLHQRVRVAPIAQQALFIMILLLIKQGIILWTSGLAGQAPDRLWLYFSAPLVGMAFWPVILVILRDMRRRFLMP